MPVDKLLSKSMATSQAMTSDAVGALAPPPAPFAAYIRMCSLATPQPKSASTNFVCTTRTVKTTPAVVREAASQKSGNQAHGPATRIGAAATSAVVGLLLPAAAETICP